MKSIVFCIGLSVFIPILCLSQPVSFVTHDDLLQPITGFANYADCVVDMNGDYMDDVVRVGGKRIFIDFQQQDNSFIQKAFHMPILTLPTWSICAGDIDNNGFNDLLFASSESVSFLKSISAGQAFEEMKMPAFVESQRSTMADINNDGWLDAFVCHDGDLSIPFRNLGDGEMVQDTNLIHTADRPGNYAAIWVDYDNDRDIDLYLTKCLGDSKPGNINRTNLLYRNNGDGTFAEVGAIAGVDDNSQSWSTSFEDFDNDGDFDAFVVNHDFANRLYRNNGDGTFSDVILTSGIDPFDLLAFENATGDFNNDGFVDIFAEMILSLYLGHGDLTFTGQEAPVFKGGIGDLNNDGFLDIVHEGKVWMNEGNANHYVKVHLEGLRGNKNGIGARIEIYGSWGKQIREVRSGQSYSPMSSLTTHFGTGLYSHIDSLIVRWPSGIITRLSDLMADTTYIVPEAECLLPATELLVEGKTDLCPLDTSTIIAADGFLQYRWSTMDTTRSISVTQPGVYAATLTDANGCVSLSEVKYFSEVLDGPPVITSGSGRRICEGDTLLLTSTEGEHYAWSTGEQGQPSIAVSTAGSYTVAVDALCSVGQKVSLPYVVELLTTSEPSIQDVFLLPGDSILLLAGGENIHWYDQSFGGEPLHMGNAFQTPSLDSSIVYYVESHHVYPGEMQEGGKQDTSGSGGVPSQGGHLFFEVWESFSLISVEVYVPEAAPQGVRFIQLYQGDSLLASKSFTVQTGMNLLVLNFDVPVGQLSLRCQQGNMFRNEDGISFPYAIGDVGQITGSSSGENYYYYFYHWEIWKPEIECISGRIPYEVIVSSIGDPEENSGFLIFPNPSSDRLQVEWKSQSPGYIRISDLFERMIIQESITKSGLHEIDMSHLPKGPYIIQIQEGHKKYSYIIILH